MLKCYKTFLGIAVLALAFSVSICFLDFSGTNRYVEDAHTPDIYCGIDVNSYMLTEDQSFSILDLTKYWQLNPHINEPRLPIFSVSIFKVPKSV
jgi:hypothetical protein